MLGWLARGDLTKTRGNLFIQRRLIRQAKSGLMGGNLEERRLCTSGPGDVMRPCALNM